MAVVPGRPPMQNGGDAPPPPRVEPYLVFREDLVELHQEFLADVRRLLQDNTENLARRLLSPKEFASDAEACTIVVAKDLSATATTSVDEGARSEAARTKSSQLVHADSCASQEMMLLHLGTNSTRDTAAIEFATRNEDDAGKEAAKAKGAFEFAGANRSSLDVDDYDVTRSYKDHGLPQLIARSSLFEHITLAVISLNAVYIGVDVDRNDEALLENADIGFQVCEHAFCTFFTAELLVRFLSFKHLKSCLVDTWFKIDAVLAAIMVVETWALPTFFHFFVDGQQSSPVDIAPLRLLRLLRLSRLLRLMKALPELVTMFKGMYVAARAVASSFLMIVMMIYIFAIVLFMLLREEETVSFQFKTLTLTMWTLFIDGTLLDGCGALLRTLLDLGTAGALLSVVVFLIFIVLSAVTIMNMLIGVLCEVVSTVSQNEKDEAAIKLLKKTVLLELRKFDDNGDGVISKDELGEVMYSPEALSVLRNLEVDVMCLKELQQMLFPNEASLVSIDTVIGHLLDYRGSLPTTVRHAVDGQAYTRHVITKQNHSLHAQLNDLDVKLERLGHQVSLCTSLHDSPGRI